MTTKVIIVDDDKDTIEIFREYLELKGINVLDTGKNGKEAVELFIKHEPEIVLLDVMMPDYDGFYTLKEIRKINPNAKVIMVTADMTNDTKEKLTKLKATDIIYKPYEIETVLTTIDKVQNGESILESNSIKNHKYTPLC